MDERDTLLKSILELQGIEKEEKSKGAEGEEMAIMARMEREEIGETLQVVEGKIIKRLTPSDKDDEMNTVLEVRAGTGTFSHDCIASQ